MKAAKGEKLSTALASWKVWEPQWQSQQYILNRRGAEVYAFNCSIQESEQADLWISGKPSLYSEFQGNQGYTEKYYLKNKHKQTNKSSSIAQ